MKSLFRLSCCLALALSCGVCAFPVKGEKKEPPEWTKSITTAPPGDFPMLEPCSLVFNVSWNGVLKAGQADVEFKVAEDGDLAGALETTGEACSTGLAHALWPYRAKHRSFVDAKTLRPLSISQSELDRQEENIYETKFIGDYVFSKRVTTPAGEGGAPETKEKVYDSGLQMHDLVSALLYVRSFPLDEDGQTFKLVTLPFDDCYLVSLTREGTEPFKFQGAGIDALKFDIEIQKIQKNGQLKSYKNKVAKAKVWLSDDALRLPLELRAEIFVGNIRATLIRHQAAVAKALEPAAAGGVGGESIVDKAINRAKNLPLLPLRKNAGKE